MAQVVLSTVLRADIDTVWQALQTPDRLIAVSRPILAFVPVDPPEFPTAWTAGEYRVRLMCLGVLPLGPHTLSISFPPPDGETRKLRDNGYSRLVRKWDHLITVEPEGTGTRYTDRVEIDAGWRTPAIVAFARVFYAHRQRRWHKLLAEKSKATQARP